MRSGPLKARYVCRICGGPRKYNTKSQRCAKCGRANRTRCSCGAPRYSRATRCWECHVRLMRSDPLWYLGDSL